MPIYLHQWRYKDKEVKAMVLRPQDREEVVRIAVEAFEGRLHAFYLCFGKYDGLIITEFPDNETALACLMAIVGQGGAAALETTTLISADEARRAMLKAGELLTTYRTPSADPD